MGGLVTPGRMLAAMRWAQARYELDQQINPVREFVDRVQEASPHKARVVGKFLAYTLVYPDGFKRGSLKVPDSDRTISGDLTVAIQNAKRIGAIDIVIDTPPAPARAVATTILLLTVLDGSPDAWLPEQARVVNPDFDVSQLWDRLDPTRVNEYKTTVDRTPLPHS